MFICSFRPHAKFDKPATNRILLFGEQQFGRGIFSFKAKYALYGYENRYKKIAFLRTS
jgi:hypothetical protein